MAKTRSGKKSKGRLTPTSFNNQQNLINNNNVTVIVPSTRKRQKARAKRVSWRDEQIHSMSVGEIDPAILFVRERIKIKYSKEELLDIAKNPASKSKPDFLDPNEVSVSILDPEKWNLERKKSDTPETGSKGSDNGDNRRRPGDPRERIRKENDGIVLSPQRRSFNSGCFVPANKEPLGVKPDVPPPHIMGVREIASSTRRIGSGRIMRDSWDNEKDPGEPEFGFGRGPQSRNNEREDKFERRGEESSKFGERRSFGRELDGGKDKEGRRNARYSESRRRYSDHKEDEPEWFSSGPLSQNDTIELRGFDEPIKPGKKKVQPSRMKRSLERAKDWSKKKETAIAEGNERDNESEPKGSSTPNQHESGGSKDENDDEQSSEFDGEGARKPLEPKEQPQTDHTFDFDEFLKGENIPGLLSNGVEDDTDKSTSRFSRWFKKESPNKDMAQSSRRSSIQEDNHIIKDLLKDINESSAIPVTIHPPMDSNTYFAPISPAGNTPGGLEGLIGDKARSSINMGQSVNIMEMLARGKQQPQQPEGWNVKPSGSTLSGGKILSLDELEAKIRQNSDHSANMPQKAPPQKPDEEMTAAFKKLLQQAGGHPVPQNGPMTKPPAMSLLEMLNHSQQQDEARFAAAQAAQQHQQQHQLLNALHAHQQQPQPQIHNDLTMKLQQAQLQQKQQMDMLGKLMSAGTVPAAAHVRASPLLDLGAQQSRELLSRPEAQAILQGLKRGEITIQHLYQQLANPALQPRHRDMLVTILKLHGNPTSYGPSPRVLSPAPLPAHHLYPPQQQAQIQQQQLRVSPLPPNAMHQRIPSPRELQVHTQNILQRALIKKKLEEQTENFRKKQEMQRGASPNPASGATSSGNQQSGTKGVSSPTPLAFTPTSVLRKMTADKDEGKENKAITDNGVKPPGRPLTGMRQQPQVTVNSQQWNQAFPMKQGNIVSAGRPIVKANNYPSQTPEQFFAQLAAQQQPLPQQRTYQAVPTAPHRKPIIGQQYPAQGSQYGSSQPQYPHPNPQSFSQPTAQQLRAQHQHRPSNSAAQQPLTNQAQQQQSQASQPSQQATTSQKTQPMGFPQGQTQQGTAAWQQFLSSAAHQQSSRPAGNLSRAGQQSGAFSPSTADQLTRWFSPDLLERARGGELPSTANLARLEEIERQAAPPVHN